MSLNLHLGCGSIHLNGYINIDVEKWCNAVDEVMDCADLKKYKTNSVDRIFNHALLEHMPPWNTLKALKEWYRVLKPNGTIQIEVPDLERIFKEWLIDKTLSEKLALDNIFGGTTIDKRYKNQFHRTGFTFDRLSRMMKECGFKDIKRIEHQKFSIILVITAKK